MTLWIHNLLLALAIAFCVVGRWRELSRLRVTLALSVAAAGVATAVLTWPGLLLAQKSVTTFLHPLGLTWMMLLAITLALWQRRERRGFCLALSVLLVLTAGNDIVASSLLRWLQIPYLDVHPMRLGEFDAVLVLGGSTATGEQGYTQLNTSGDRVALGARLYRLGRTKRLIASGSGFLPPDPGAQATLIWQQLGVPPQAIVRIGGRNTSEELREFARLARGQRWQRIGLVTSAWHLRRAMRQAARQEIEVVPIPADFRRGDPWWVEPSLIPTPGAMRDIQTALHEMIGMAAGR